MFMPLHIKNDFTVEVLMMGGGGGGGGRANSNSTGTGAGGGGAGGLVLVSSDSGDVSVVIRKGVSFIPGTTYSVIPGAGGAGATAGVAAANGSNTTIAGINATAIGGGRGGNWDATTSYNMSAAGGCGGGGCGLNDGGSPSNGIPYLGGGKAGGSGLAGAATTYPGGGGGGTWTGGTASTATVAGNGGSGWPSLFNGNNLSWGGGGRGNSFGGSVGTAGTGDGGYGNGGGASGEGAAGGAGAAGIVLIRYRGPVRATGGTITGIANYGTLHTFTTVGANNFTPIPASNGNDSFTKALLHADTAAGSASGVDSSASNHILTFNNGATVTSGGKFGSGNCLYFTGTSPNISLSGTQSDFDFGAGDFTIDWWEYRTASTTGCPVFTRGVTGADPLMVGYSNQTSLVAYAYSTTSWDVLNAFVLGTISLSTWTHFALARANGRFYGFKNGVLTGSVFNNTLAIGTTAQVPILGMEAPSGPAFTGYVDEFRITKGLARWVIDFTPPTAPYS